MSEGVNGWCVLTFIFIVLYSAWTIVLYLKKKTYTSMCEIVNAVEV
jgi:hypothetical protein